MDKNTILNGKFSYKALPDGSLDRTKVICVSCRAEFSYHRSTSSLKYHLSAKHTADAESPASPRLKQTTLNVQGKQMESSTKCKLETEIAKWVATACQPISIVQDVGLRESIRIASND